MSPRASDPDAGLITFHPSVVVLVGVTLRLVISECITSTRDYIPSMDICAHTPDEIHKV